MMENTTYPLRGNIGLITRPMHQLRSLMLAVWTVNYMDLFLSVAAEGISGGGGVERERNREHEKKKERMKERENERQNERNRMKEKE